jgi:hypothetical protein
LIESPEAHLPMLPLPDFGPEFKVRNGPAARPDIAIRH